MIFLFPSNNSQFLNYFLCFLIVTGYLFYNSIVHRLFGFIFFKNNEFHEYIHYKSIFNKVIGLLLLPIIIIIGLSSKLNINYFIISGIVITLLLYGISMMKVSLIMISKRIHVLHWILYLFSIEILPLIISYKILITIL